MLERYLLSKKLQVVLSVMFVVSGFGLLSCGTNYGSISPDPTPTLTWMQQDSYFTTNDTVKAQAEIPFPLRLPTYFPPDQKVTLPHIQGTVDQTLQDDIYVSIKYLLTPSRGAIQIEERNRPIIPGDPETDPRYEYTQIGGKELIKTEGNFAMGKGVIYYFSLDGIYFRIEIDNLASEETVKIIESIIVQSN